MQKQRSTTLQARLGFQDGELTTPRHDEIMLWLDGAMESLLPQLMNVNRIRTEWDESVLWSTNKMVEKWAAVLKDAREILDSLRGKLETAQASLNKMLPTDPLWRINDARSTVSKLGSRIDEGTITVAEAELFVLPTPPEYPGIHLSKTWEKPIMNGKFMVGFVDMWVEATPRVLGYQWSDLDDDDKCTCRSRPELYIGYPHPAKGKQKTLLFEVKPTITSLGEVMRQARMYLEYVRKNTVDFKMFIVCPDDRFKAALEAQGIGFIKCP
ncbi:MAG: hypothetical protein WCB12_22580 [Bryobacteraceae bacterium]